MNCPALWLGIRLKLASDNILHYELAMQLGPVLDLFHRRWHIRAPQKVSRIFIFKYCLLDCLGWAASLRAASQSFGPFTHDAWPCLVTCLPFNDLQALADAELGSIMIVAIRDLSYLAESILSLLSLL